MCHSRKIEHEFMRIPMTLHSKNCWLKMNQLLFTKKTLQSTEIFKFETVALSKVMNGIFHFVESKRDHAIYCGSKSLSSFAPKL